MRLSIQKSKLILSRKVKFHFRRKLISYWCEEFVKIKDCKNCWLVVGCCCSCCSKSFVDYCCCCCCCCALLLFLIVVVVVAQLLLTHLWRYIWRWFAIWWRSRWFPSHLASTQHHSRRWYILIHIVVTVHVGSIIRRRQQWRLLILEYYGTLVTNFRLLFEFILKDDRYALGAERFAFLFIT